MNLGKIRGTAVRLLQMDGTELRFRLNQELAKRQDRLLSALGYDFAGLVTRSRPSRPPRFFFEAEEVEGRLSLIRDRLPEVVESIVSQAENILSHRFDLLGYRDLHYGQSIDWHFDVVHGARAPQKIFYRVPYLNFQVVGDSKVTWELNRHQHFVTLAKAYRLTGDNRFLFEIGQQWRYWWMQNPYPIGINWASSLELGFRSLSWLWTYHLLDGVSSVPIRREEWLHGWALHGRHIERYLSTYFSPNTHLLGEGVALLFLGILCPELSTAERWKSLGWNIVLQEAQRQVQADGFHFEQSTYYHVYALDFFLHATILAKWNGMTIPPMMTRTLEKMLGALHLLGSCGSPPRLGDDDGGRLFDPRRNRGEHLLDPLATGAILFERPEFKAAAWQLCEETIWLCGPTGVKVWDELPAKNLVAASHSLPAAGLYFLSSDNPSTQLVVDCGALGTQSGGHGHADALSITLQSEGRDLLLDPGTCEYAGDSGDRNLFRGTAMHNTVRVDGLDQAEIGTAFSWKTLTQPKVESWIRGQSFELLAATHDSYGRLPEPVIHRRFVFSLRNGIFLVRDCIKGKGRHHLDVAWHLGQDMESVKPGIFKANGQSSGLAILDAEPSRWSKKIEPSFWSPAYGQKQPTKVLVHSTDSELPSTICFLLVTLKGAYAQAGSFVRLNHPEHGLPVSAYRFQEEVQEHTFLFGKAGNPWRYEAVSSDAEFVSLTTATSGTAGRIILVNGSRVRVQGAPELVFKRSVEWGEIAWREDYVEVHSSDPGAIGPEVTSTGRAEKI
ncbi:MAG TPA: alginate lyase family protein [Candidatus Sulfotelmatobacter sp.]|nr:alginate lyase family protein [Candidatus Sulfotelmatobacter sp.]